MAVSKYSKLKQSHCEKYNLFTGLNHISDGSVPLIYEILRMHLAVNLQLNSKQEFKFRVRVSSSLSTG